MRTPEQIFEEYRALYRAFQSLENAYLSPIGRKEYCEAKIETRPYSAQIAASKLVPLKDKLAIAVTDEEFYHLLGHRSMQGFFYSAGEPKPMECFGVKIAVLRMFP
ncbi:hypothetical protein [Gluconobacter wancherniae]|uniref:hypothetical protein n=1 Tax=Gluconobacter wancherniae TaxID=1307955 RepID=UPI001B8CDACA|nr:hypothetical protein [Gluconobacter wancherniae]MBS1063423.1 hypothetical protein [Gluconobacter wancherniae]MBS1093848.1 hypothetical protein [Gluconobacter wancherniae]